ncbi:MAG: MFS transporter [Bryobacterales bacterium]|nr:MFS transporter [Bryobacterales bacterium]
MRRYLVVGGLFALSLITYVDRAAISSAKDAVTRDLALNDQAMGAVFSAFALGYALAQTPSGWIADRFGPRLMLSAVVVVWSVLTAATGAVQSFTSILIVRFLFGLAEAGAFPGAARAIYNWLPPSERGRANGIMFSASRWGAAAAFPLMAWLLDAWGWRWAFYLLALPGLAWAAAWFLLFRDRPDLKRVELQTAPATSQPLGETLRSLPFLLALVQYFSVNFVTFLCLSWMLPYLKQRYSLSNADAALYAMWPLLIGGGAQWISGFLVDALYQSGRRSWSRRAPAILGFALAAAGVGALPFAETPLAGAVCFSIAALGADLTISPSWAFCMDVGGSNSGTVSGSMNMAGNLGSFVSANMFPYLQSLTGSAAAYFAMVSLMCVASGFCWIRMRSLSEDRSPSVPRS